MTTNRVILLGCAAALLLSGVAVTSAPAQAPPPWERTETRADCGGFELLRSPFFGETHVHTEYSADAWVAGALGTPSDAYTFAKGAPLGLPPLDGMGMPTRSAQLKRPLDFTIVTDHAEQFGEVQMCQMMGSTGYNEPECTDMRDLISEIPFPPPPSPLPDSRVLNFLIAYLVNPPAPFSWCGPGRVDCLAAAAPVWADTQAAAEAHYDRTAACSFTTFVGYEWSAGANSPVGPATYHRNVVFRNDVVPATPTSFVDEQGVQGLFDALESSCLDPGLGCDVLTIPHNTNVSGGLTFAPLNDDTTPFTPADAAERRIMEPLVELINHKGESECQPGVGTTDELCGFEKSYRPTTFTIAVDTDPASYEPLSFIRNALKEGLAQEQGLGVNPFTLGFVGGTDTHNATPGLVNEEEWGGKGHNGLRDHEPAYILSEFPPSGIPTNPSGLAVVWAEENSRDALFAAMKRRETYGTSGPRILLWFDLVDAPQGRAPMGSEVEMAAPPRFVVRAAGDFVQLPGCPAESPQGLAPERLAHLCHGQCYNPSDRRHPIAAIEVVRIRPQRTPDEDVGGLIEDPWLRHDCPADPAGCSFAFDDPEFATSGRDAVYYVRAVQEATPAINAANLRTEFDADGNAVRVAPCSGSYRTPADDDCLAPVQERAWSSPIFVDQPRRG